MRVSLSAILERAPGLALLWTRRSEPKLAAPAPSEAELAFALELAATAPDHRSLTPYRVIALWPDGAEGIVEHLERERPDDAARARVTLSRAPLFLVVVFHPVHGARTPLEEQRDAAAAATGYLLLALWGLGYSSMWRTGRLARDPLVAEHLGLDTDEQIIALVGVGTSLGVALHPRDRRPTLTHLGSARSQETLGQA